MSGDAARVDEWNAVETPDRAEDPIAINPGETVCGTCWLVHAGGCA